MGRTLLCNAVLLIVLAVSLAQPERIEQDDEALEAIEDKEKMLCNVIVRATHDLYIHQRKSVDEIIAYLEEDCQNLENEELIEQCRTMIDEHATQIYQHVRDGTEMSQVCKKIEENNDIDLDQDRSLQCAQGAADKCHCCIMHVKKRKMRLRFIVKLMARKRLERCERSPRPQRCREWVRRREWQALKKIEQICPYVVCKHFGYCEAKSADVVVSAAIKMDDAGESSPSVWFEMLDQQLEAHLTKDVCPQFEQSETLCVHIGASVDSRHYARVYAAVLDDNTKWITDNLEKEAQLIQKNTNADLCESCKNTIQSSTNLYLQLLDKVRDALHATCEQCPAKDKCNAFFDQGINSMDAYLHSVKPDAFCSTMGLCSFLVPVLLTPEGDESKDCNVCIQRFQPRKDAAIAVINQLSPSFANLCAEKNTPECQALVSEMITAMRSFINEFDLQDACFAMGLCGTNATQHVDDYEHALMDAIGTNICSKLGPFEALCQQVVQGAMKPMQTIDLNTVNIDDFFAQCEEPAEEKTGSCAQDRDKCKCCINHVIQKKKCLKKRVAIFIWQMIQSCKRCPVEDQCRQYWEKKKACWDAKIDRICPKKACIHMGYCKKADRSSVCANMGPFQKACEQALSTVGQFVQDIQQKIPALQPVKEEAKEQVEVIADKLNLF